ncbi:major facilitator superfamily MFS_1 [Alkalidesulfovibrio alkalitolerans DSM 16529]|jgi:MFS family permease|uniref:Major facilitator superfamily MFS_1 n=1 Tax=Alkalidesulfovibrio alkalitolerans DSM 16529 TaxID=1121439 RepID=S7UKH2_9BACT|nr:MFS transporter [Alkalidesulfovibrio alkalitolerans]EPR32793.1 major facilitator superfamily MFS_1 [Alkalidesulfovibrio alkalitolerans DSM 16529]
MNTGSQFARLCWVGFLARFSYALARNPVLPLFALTLGAGPEAVGLAVGISTVTGILFKLPSGALSDVIGRRRTMLAGLVFFGLAPFAYLFITDYWQLVAVRFLHGFATAIYGPVAMAVVADIAGARKGELLSWFSSVGIIGGLLGAPVGGLMLSLTALPEGGYAPWAFPMVYAVCGLAGFSALLLGFRTLLREEQVAGGGFGERLGRFVSGIREVSSDRRVVAASAMEGVQNMSMGALEAFLPIYAVTVAGLSAFEAGLLWASQIVVTMLAKPLMGRVSDRAGRKPLIVTGLLCCAVSFAAVPWLAGFWALLAACLVFGLGEALVTSSSAAMVAELCKANQYGTAMGVFGTIFDVGHAAGPIVAGLLVASLGYAPAFAIISALLLVSVPWFVAATRDVRKGAAEGRNS